jgi:glycosyltransferase involved in cell wall biosynthesis
MKIAVNTRLLLKGRLDGIGWFTLENLSRICRNHPEHEFHFIFDRVYDPDFVFSSNVIPHVLPPQARHPILFKIWYDWSLPFLLWRIRPDVLISPDAMLSMRTKIPQLLVVHDLNFIHYPNDLPEIISRYWRRQTPRFVDKAARIVTVSEFSKSDIIRQFGVDEGLIDVVHNGVNETYGPLDTHSQRQVREKWTGGFPYFLFVSSIHPRKNLQRLLPAFDQFRLACGEQVKLLVVGKRFWLNDELDQVYRNMIHRDDVIFADRLEADELRAVTASALASVYVSYFEGFGIPIIEAFKCGVPVITSNVTSMPEVAGNAGILVNPFSIDEIAKAMHDIWSNPSLREELIRRGFERVKQYSWDKSSELLWESILKVTNHVESGT